MAQTPGTDTMHGGMAHPGGSGHREKRLGAKVKLSGAAEKDVKETRSEAEGKIETDFLAGVKIIEGQMIQLSKRFREHWVQEGFRWSGAEGPGIAAFESQRRAVDSPE